MSIKDVNNVITYYNSCVAAIETLNKSIDNLYELGMIEYTGQAIQELTRTMEVLQDEISKIEDHFKQLEGLK